MNSDTVEIAKKTSNDFTIISDSFAQLLSNKRIMVLVNDTIFSIQFIWQKDYSNLKDEEEWKNKICLL